MSLSFTWGFPKIRGIILGAPIIRSIVFWVLYWGPPIWGNYHLKHVELRGLFPYWGLVGNTGIYYIGNVCG